MKNETEVRVEWNDSNVIHGWRLDENIDDDVAHCQVRGLLIFEDIHKVTVAFGNSDYGSIFETITIPRGCITKIVELGDK